MNVTKTTLPKQSDIEIVFFLSGYYEPEAGILNVDPGSDHFLGFSPQLWQQPHFIDSLLHKDDVASWLSFTESDNGLPFETSQVFRVKDKSSNFRFITFQVSYSSPSLIRLSLIVKSFPVSDRVNSDRLYDAEASLMSDQASYYLNIVGVIIITLDDLGRITLLNRFACGLLGVTQAEALGLNWFDSFLPESDRPAAQLAFDNLMKGVHVPSQEVERPVINSRGERLLIRWYNQVLVGADGERYGILSSGTDITEQRESESAVKIAEERSRLLLENSKEGIFGIDLQGCITFINPSAANMLGYQSDELINKNSHELFHHSDKFGNPLPVEQCLMLSAARDGKSYRVDTDVLWCKDGDSFPVEYWSAPIMQNGEVIGSVVTFHDITHRKQAEEQIRYLAFHDALTGLPNRRLFQDRFEHELLLNKRSGNICALHILDVDHFKEINDTRGHPAGDSLLIEVAHRISKLLRAGDNFARLGGDEFAILQSAIEDPVDVAALSEKIIVSFRQPFDLGTHSVKTSVSSGVVICDKDLTVDEWISRGDVALYRAKENGRACYAFYQQEMTDRVKRDAELAHLLGSAQLRNQLSVEYQPQYRCDTQELVGAEALLRWNHPDLKDVGPEVFIHIAEKRGMIEDIGMWVTQQVCADVKRWRDQRLSFGRISFNLSPVQMRHEEGMSDLFRVLECSGVPLECLEIEVTESACMDASVQTLDLLDSYVKSGLKLAVDDFGTGYSSMVVLRQLNVSRLKIDQSFIKDMLRDKNDELIVIATISLAHSLGLSVVAEGVESQAQLARLCDMNCDVVQGFYLSRPLPTDAFVKLITA